MFMVIGNTLIWISMAGIFVLNALFGKQTSKENVCSVKFSLSLIQQTGEKLSPRITFSPTDAVLASA